ncbi:hypothetical protein Tco_1153806 [Tanacetum coccineum]
MEFSKSLDSSVDLLPRFKDAYLWTCLLPDLPEVSLIPIPNLLIHLSPLVSAIYRANTDSIIFPCLHLAQRRSPKEGVGDSVSDIGGDGDEVSHGQGESFLTFCLVNGKVGKKQANQQVNDGRCPSKHGKLKLLTILLASTQSHSSSSVSRQVIPRCKPSSSSGSDSVKYTVISSVPLINSGLAVSQRKNHGHPLRRRGPVVYPNTMTRGMSPSDTSSYSAPQKALPGSESE